MARMNMEEITEIQEAIAELKKIKSEIAKDKKMLVEALDMAERGLMDRLFDAVRLGVKKSK